MALERELLEPNVIETAECRGEAAQRADELQLARDEVLEQAEPGLLRKLEAALGLALHLDERIATGQHVAVHLLAAIRCKRQVAALVRGFEGPARQLAGGADMRRPRHEEGAEAHVGPGLVTLEPALFDQLIAKPAELSCGLVLVEVSCRDQTEPYVGDTGSVAIAVLEAEIDLPARDQGMQVCIREECGGREPCQNVERRERRRIAHHGQIDQALDGAVSELRPDLFVFASHLLRRWVWRPVDPVGAQGAQALEADVDRPVGPLEHRVDVHAQTGDARPIYRIGGAAGERVDALLRRRELASQELAFGLVERELEAEPMAALPAIVRQQDRAGGQIAERRRVGGGRLGALAGGEIELGKLLALVPCGDQGHAAVELVDNLEDHFVALLGRDLRGEQVSDAEMGLGARRFRYQ